MFNRRLKTRIPISRELLKPETYDTEIIKKLLIASQEKQKKYYNKTAKERDYETIKNVKELYVLYNGTWNKALNMGEADTPRSLRVKLADGTILKRNTKWLRLVQIRSGFGETEGSEKGFMTDGSGNLENGRNISTRVGKRPAYLKDFV